MRQMRVVERRVTSLAAKSDQIRAMGKTDMQRKANDTWTNHGRSMQILRAHEAHEGTACPERPVFGRSSLPMCSGDWHLVGSLTVPVGVET